MRESAGVGWALTLTLLSCSERRAALNTTTQPSPNASILPAPLASAAELTGAAPVGSRGPTVAPVDSVGKLVIREPEPPPEPAPGDRPLPEDTLTSKDAAGYTLEGAFRWADLPSPPPVPEGSTSAAREALAKTELTLVIDLAAVGRMRLALTGAAFPLPARTEIRAKTSYYGHVLVWPTGSVYRVLPPGSMRALFAERRADVTPLLRATVKPGENGLLLGHKTLQADVETSLGVLSLEQAAVPGSGGGGELLCRLLVELVGAEPTATVCRPERVPLSARYRWTGGGSISFIATSLSDRRDLPVSYVLVPPLDAVCSPGELPPSPSGVLLARGDLSRLHTRAVHAGPHGSRAPSDGITASNETTIVQYLLLDGVPVAWMRPRSLDHIIGPLPGRYWVSWRDFLGAEIPPGEAMELPALARIGSLEPDGGAHP